MPETDTPRCPNQALYQYAWAGRIMRGCEQHTNIMYNLATVMGAVLTPEPILPGQHCSHPDDLETLTTNDES